MRVFIVLLGLFLCVLVLSCNGKGGQAAAVAGIAGAAQVVQTARSQNPKAAKQSSEGCCVYCGDGYFPCGDECFVQATLPPCVRPPGCACYGFVEGMPPPPSIFFCALRASTHERAQLNCALYPSRVSGV